jgi:hypothetical protein
VQLVDFLSVMVENKRLD